MKSPDCALWSVAAGTVGLREWTVVLPEDGLADVLGRLDAAGVTSDGGLTADPWGNAVRFVSER